MEKILSVDQTIKLTSETKGTTSRENAITGRRRRKIDDSRSQNF